MAATSRQESASGPPMGMCRLRAAGCVTAATPKLATSRSDTNVCFRLTVTDDRHRLSGHRRHADDHCGPRLHERVRRQDGPRHAARAKVRLVLRLGRQERRRAVGRDAEHGRVDEVLDTGSLRGVDQAAGAVQIDRVHRVAAAAPRGVCRRDHGRDALAGCVERCAIAQVAARDLTDAGPVGPGVGRGPDEHPHLLSAGHEPTRDRSTELSRGADDENHGRVP